MFRFIITTVRILTDKAAYQRICARQEAHQDRVTNAYLEAIMYNNGSHPRFYIDGSGI
jgi:hypothetical protein